MVKGTISPDDIEAFIARWGNLPGGAERANFQPFIYELTGLLGLKRPDPAEGGVLGAYQFDGPVPGGSARSAHGKGFMDLYKRSCFVMEAKQSQLAPGQKEQAGLFDQADVIPLTPAGARYDRLMVKAQGQAKNYAVNLPASEPNVPFLIVCDIGRAFEIFFDFAGNGRGYGFYPDRKSYRIPLAALRDPETRALLRDLWTDPAARDPRLRAAEVTRDVSRRLAEISKALEQSNRYRARALASAGMESAEIEETALFLMRLLFCMFAEDIGLLPKERFKEFLAEAVENDDWFEQGLKDLWAAMNAPSPANRFAAALRARVEYFNGGLFENNRVFALTKSDRGELLAAARADWRKVEPAIFGTLLEQALTAEERARLGAHYTPRAYVERLVDATIMDVLNTEWEEAQERMTDPAATADAALAVAKAFHHRLAAISVLDPACGTGNFLYVAMEAIERLEAQVIEAIDGLGGDAEPQVGPHQFFGLELNPRAAKITELVLWIGWLRFRIQNNPESVPEPILARGANINFGRHGGYDAVLQRKETGEPDLDQPLQPTWPEAEFIVGNPPFIGGKDIRDRLGGDYAEALWRANPNVPGSADFVMQWWDRAAMTLTAPSTRLRRFGLVTTNSITQEFSRRVVARHLSPTAGRNGLSLVMAIPDHPWTKATRDSAAVRIAMTVAEAGEHDGTLLEVVRQNDLETDDPQIELIATKGRINATLTVGADTASARPLRSNEGLASPGVKLHGAGFIVTPSEAKALGLGKRAGIENHIRPYRNGRDLLGRPRGVMVIDFFGLSETEVRNEFPEAYQHLLANVRNRHWDENKKKWEGREEVVRKANEKGGASQDALSYLEFWWLHGKPRPELRCALAGLQQYIATVETSKHRIFQFLDASILPDNMLVVIASDDAFHLGVLSSRLHTEWALRAGGMLEDRPRYNKGKVFDPFPFPDPTPDQRVLIAQLAEELDTARKAALDETPGLTMTEIYNLRSKVASGEAMEMAERDRAVRARAGIVNRLHEQIDEAVTEAYGWPADLAPAEIVAHLVALNAERAAEETAGTIRWLRPDYQIPRFSSKARE